MPPAYTSQPPTIPTRLPPNASEHSLSSSLPPYSRQLPANHIVIPPDVVAALIPTNRPPPTQVIPSHLLQPSVHHPPPPQPQAQVQPQEQVVQHVTPPQSFTSQPMTPQIIQPQSHFAPPLPYSAPYYLIDGIPSGPILPAGPYFGPIPYQSLSFPLPFLPSPSQPLLHSNPMLLPGQPQIPVQPQPQPQMQLQLQQPMMMTDQGMLFREDGFPGPGSLPPGGRWAVSSEPDGRRTLWTIMPGETRPAGWAYD